MGLRPARRGRITGPGILFRFLDHRRTDWVQDDTAAYLEKVAVFLDQDGLVPALEQVTRPAVPLVDELGEDAVQLPHADVEIAVRGFNEETVVIGHEAVCVAGPVVACIHVLERVQEIIAVMVVLEYKFPFVAA
jgi:hypothetical protein